MPDSMERMVMMIDDGVLLALLWELILTRTDE
jgi:hypothetical protein